MPSERVGRAPSQLRTPLSPRKVAALKAQACRPRECLEDSKVELRAHGAGAGVRRSPEAPAAAATAARCHCARPAASQKNQAERARAARDSMRWTGRNESYKIPGEKGMRSLCALNFNLFD